MGFWDANSAVLECFRAFPKTHPFGDSTKHRLYGDFSNARHAPGDEGFSPAGGEHGKQLSPGTRDDSRKTGRRFILRSRRSRPSTPRGSARNVEPHVGAPGASALRPVKAVVPIVAPPDSADLRIGVGPDTMSMSEEA